MCEYIWLLKVLFFYIDFHLIQVILVGKISLKMLEKLLMSVFQHHVRMGHLGALVMLSLPLLRRLKRLASIFNSSSGWMRVDCGWSGQVPMNISYQLLSL